VRQGGGALLIIGAIAALWVYNTGRATAVINAIKDPNSITPRHTATTTTASNGGGGSGTSELAIAEKCWAQYATTGDPSCVMMGQSQIIGNQIPGIKEINGLFGDIFGAIGGLF
jgi:hypothetical protein